MTQAAPQTGPRTESGKARSSQNAIKSGLFATHDHILNEEEREEYTKSLTDLRHELRPQGVLEETFLSEIMTANWRLRRCRLIEAGFAIRELPDNDDQLQKAQKSVDRARALSHTILRRSLAELRKLQTERAIRTQLHADLHPCLADSRRIMDTVRAFTQYDAAVKRHHNNEQSPNVQTPSNNSFCNPTQKHNGMTPRNATCPCGSGEKFKRCCGKDAPPVLNRAA